jgi:hypothetical protein
MLKRIIQRVLISVGSVLTQTGQIYVIEKCFKYILLYILRTIYYK